jgi:serine/threonine-protein kinase RsbW
VVVLDGLPTTKVVVTIPARPEVVHILRSVAASVASRSDLTIDAIDDLRIAVDEACAQLISAAPDAATLTMIADAEGERAEVQLCTSGKVATWPPDGLQRTLAWQVLNGLADEVSFGRAPQGPSVVIRKRGVARAERP